MLKELKILKTLFFFFNAQNTPNFSFNHIKQFIILFFFNEHLIAMSAMSLAKLRTGEAIFWYINH